VRVAVYEPRARTCGVTAYTHHVAAGLRAIGHHADVVTFTRSGRPRSSDSAGPGKRATSWSWWTEPADVYAALADAGRVLDGYDLVFLNEVKNGTADNEAERRREEPPYITALRATRTPWLSAVHAPLYQPRRTPFLRDLLALPNYTGRLVAHQLDCDEDSGGVFSTSRFAAWPCVPYRARRNVDSPAPDSRTVVTTGRFVDNKGPSTVACSASDFLPEGWTLELWGAAPGGPGPNQSFVLYEAMFREGWRGQRDGQNEKPDDRGAELNNRGDIVSGWPWWLEKDGRRVEFRGGYVDGVETASRGSVAVALTSSSFARGVELTALECMDAGCSIVLPRHAMWSGVPYEVHVVESFDRTVSIGPNGFRRDRLGEEVYGDIVDTVKRAVESRSSRDASVNRKLLRTHHDPAAFAEFLVRVADGSEPTTDKPPSLGRRRSVSTQSSLFD
jgi:hypothetical protein